MNAPLSEPIQLVLEDAVGQSIGRPRKQPISPEFAAWVARRRRERDGLPLRPCDREQVSEQMEDL
jgi:hypothetical protein